MVSTQREAPDRSERKPFDLLIRGGLVYDGTGAEPYLADVAVSGGLIAAVGDLDGRAETVIEARDKLVTPGFIDIHTHCDDTYRLNGIGPDTEDLKPAWKANLNHIYQGVTTVVTGNCGQGYVDTAHWLGLVDALGLGVGVCHLVPHGDLRAVLFDAQQPGRLTRRQTDLLKAKLGEGMEQGAFGFSTGLEYAPGFLARKEELVALARVAARHNGIYATHLRDESGRPTADGTPGLLAAVQEAIEVAQESGVRLQISHLKLTAPQHGLEVERVLELIEQARDKGVDVAADQYPYEASATILTIRLPQEMIGPGGRLKERYLTRQGRREVRRAVEKTYEWMGPKQMLVTHYVPKPSYEGKTVSQIALLESKHPADAFVDLVCHHEPPHAVFFGQEPADVRRVAARDYVATASDGSTVDRMESNPHPRFYGTFPKKIRSFALDGGDLGLAAVIRSMTSLPAQRLRLKDRGLVREGLRADLAVLDPASLKDLATYENPHQYAKGVDYLISGGVVSIEEGEFTGRTAGRAVRA